MCTHTRSLTLIYSTGVGFCHEIRSDMIGNGQIRSSRLKSRPRAPETVQKWVLWIKKCSWSWYGHCPIQEFFCFETDTWILWVQNIDFFDLVRDGCLRLTRKRNKGFGTQFKSGSGEISEFSCHQVREIVDNIHVSVGTLSGTLFVKAFNRGRF